MMPQSSQNLYFHLGMNADDDGFCEHFTIMRMTESKPDDLKVLHTKGFVNIFDDKVLVILDWKENNYIQSDRYTPSRYLEIYKEEVKLLAKNKEKTECIQNVYKVDTQVRLGKVRKGKSNILRAEAREEWNFKKYLEGMDNHTRRDLQIIALYWKFKKFNFTNRKQAEIELRRNLRAAKELEPNEDEKIWQTMDWLAKNADFKWTLESCGKYINENLSALKIK